MPNQARADRHADLMAGARVPRDRTAEGPPRPAVGVEALRAFTDAVLGPHRLTPATPATPDFVPMCSCGLPARCCDIVKAEHEVLGIAMPFTFGPLPRPPDHAVQAVARRMVHKAGRRVCARPDCPSTRNRLCECLHPVRTSSRLFRFGRFVVAIVCGLFR